MNIDEFAPSEILKAIIRVNNKDERETKDSREPMRSAPGARVLKALFLAPDYRLSRDDLIIEAKIKPSQLNKDFGFLSKSVLRVLGVKEESLEEFPLTQKVLHKNLETFVLRPSVVAAIKLVKSGSIEENYLWTDWAFGERCGSRD